MQQQTMTRIFGGLFLGVVLIAQTVFIVPETHQVLVLQFGDPVEQYATPGLKVKIPFIQQLQAFDSRVLDVDPRPEEVILSDKKITEKEVFSCNV